MSQGMLNDEANALAAVAGPFKAFNEKLMGQDALIWLEAFKRFLRKENPWPTTESASQPAPTVANPPNFPIWKTITVGGMSRDELLAAFEAKGFKASNWAKGMMTKPEFVITPEPRKIDLVLATVGDLGFPKGDTTREIWKRIKELGSLCPPDLGPHLRLAYADQPDGENIWVAMEQIVDSDGYPYVFMVHRVGGERWLDGGGAPPGDRWDPCDRIAFVRPRK